MSLNDFVTEIKQFTENSYRNIDVINAILKGNLNKDELAGYAKRHYAEIRTFLDIKIPARMRLCPPHAYNGKKYFWYLYREEHGFFKPGENHAELFKPICYALGLSDEDLENEFELYWPNYRYLLDLTPSNEVFISELAISVAWESFSPVVGPELIAALKRYGFEGDSLKYFSLHYEVDQRHGDQAYKTLNEYVTDLGTQEIAIKAISRTFGEDLYFNM